MLVTLDWFKCNKHSLLASFEADFKISGNNDTLFARIGDILAAFWSHREFSLRQIRSGAL